MLELTFYQFIGLVNSVIGIFTIKNIKLSHDWGLKWVIAGYLDSNKE